MPSPRSSAIRRDHLGALAAALGDTTRAAELFRAALAKHERLGAAGWTRLTAQALAELFDPPAMPAEMSSEEWTAAGNCPSDQGEDVGRRRRARR